MIDPHTTDTIFDVAVIGGGITGTAVARDAALRGIHPILIEKNSLASGTSSKSSKLIHGGIRYLETAWNALRQGRILEFWKNIKFVLLSLRECRILEKNARSLIQPIPILIPVYQSDSRGLLKIFTGTLIYTGLALLWGHSRFSASLRVKGKKFSGSFRA